MSKSIIGPCLLFCPLESNLVEVWFVFLCYLGQLIHPCHPTCQCWCDVSILNNGQKTWTSVLSDQITSSHVLVRFCAQLYTRIISVVHFYSHFKNMNCTHLRCKTFWNDLSFFFLSQKPDISTWLLFFFSFSNHPIWALQFNNSQKTSKRGIPPVMLAPIYTHPDITHCRSISTLNTASLLWKEKNKQTKKSECLWKTCCDTVWVYNCNIHELSGTPLTWGQVARCDIFTKAGRKWRRGRLFQPQSHNVIHQNCASLPGLFSV